MLVLCRGVVDVAPAAVSSSSAHTVPRLAIWPALAVGNDEVLVLVLSRSWMGAGG
jgi:hypothetical protein